MEHMIRLYINMALALITKTMPRKNRRQKVILEMQMQMIKKMFAIL